MSRLRNISLYAFGVAVALCLSVVASAPASAAEGTATVKPVGEQQAALDTCVFHSFGDYVHISNTPPEAASGHGWWTNVDCPTNLAIVTVQLQILQNGSWTNAGAAGFATVPPGGGPGKRATGRVPCRTIAFNQWRSIVDVDLVGLFDTSEVVITSSRGLYCGL